MEKPYWVVCQGSPFLCKHWWCSWSSKARHYWGGSEAPLSKPHSRTAFSVTWNGEITKKGNAGTSARIEPLPLRVWQRTTVNMSGFHYYQLTRLALKRQSRWKVLALLPPWLFSCSRDRTARVSCLNRGHFEALTSNCSLAWLWSAGHFLSVHQRQNLYLFGFHPSLLSEVLAMLSPMTHNEHSCISYCFFSYKNYIRKGLQYTLLQGYLFDTISVDLHSKIITHAVYTLPTDEDFHKKPG